jgi:PAS domain S-box-containing protein
MTSHPVERKRHFPEKAPVAWDPLRRGLGENEDWYRDLVEHSQDLLCVHDLEGRFLSVNPGPARLLGYSVEEMLHMPMRDFVDAQFRSEFDVYLREIERTGQARGLMAVVTRSGDRRIWEYHNRLRTEGVARPIVMGIAHDVTERVRAEKALRTSNEELVSTARERERTIRDLTLFRTLLDQSNDAIKVIDPETLRFLDVNEKACAELGYSRDELLSMTVYDIDPNADESLVARVRQQWCDSGFAIMETVHRRKDGTTFPVEVNMRLVRLDREYGVSISRDITERKRAEERLREFERVVENLEEMIVVVNREHRYVLANRAYLSYRGMTKEQVVGRLVIELVSPELYEAVLKEKLDECFQGKIVSFELRQKYPDRGERDLSITYLPVEGSGGIDRVACVVRDITERKRAEERLLEFERVVENLEEMIVVIDRERRYVLVNRACLRYRGRTKEQVAGRLLAEVVGPEFYETVIKAKLDECFGGKVVSFELRHVYPEMGERDLSVTYLPVEGTAGIDRVACVMCDITEQKRADEALRQSEERFRVAIKNSPIAVFSQDRDLRYTWMYNPHVLRPGGHLGKTPGEFFGPEDGQRITEIRRKVLETGVGQRHEVQITDGGKKKFFDTTIEPVLDSSGAVIGLTGASMDVTELREMSEALRDAKKKLTEEKLYLEQEIDTELGFGEIIGQSKALQGVMEQVSKVAASDATVLLLGETGTGKELVARAIHRLSRRDGNSFIKMNCAAIPSGLLESELFGNEKGAFTGAISKKIGRLELADKGTLFLDEIGEISLALQPKLLRVLQDQEFERLGATQTLKVDFRLIAATNRDLAHSVRENEFRSDLYYRLNVFPIRVPPLRERREDIRLLVEHFVQKFSRRMNKSITSIPKRTMDGLMGWDWPGNVRELENFIERSVILTQGSVLVSPLSELQPTTTEDKGVDETLEAAEREHILRALRESHGQVGGLRGAAARLGVKRTTLQSKLKHLRINPRSEPQ